MSEVLAGRFWAALLCWIVVVAGANVSDAGFTTFNGLHRGGHDLQVPSDSVLQRIAVFGDDDRVPLPRNMAALANSVGLLSSSSERTACTAFCVGRRTVATAAHCVFRTAGERRTDLASFHFTVGRATDRRKAWITGRSHGAHRQHVIAGSSTLTITPPIDATRDWALMRLDQPVCERHSLFVEKSTPARLDRLGSSGRLLHVAFHGDFGNWKLALSRACATKRALDAQVRRQIKRDFADTRALVLHECDTGLASSGSPLLALGGDNRLSVVGMNVGTYQQTRYLVTGHRVTHRFKPATIANTAVSGSAFADHILAFTRADIITQPGDVRRLQTALVGSGFNPGKPDGVYGERTRRAVIAFETAHGRPGLGLATQQLLRDVLSAPGR